MADVLEMKRDSLLHELMREQVARQRAACALEKLLPCKPRSNRLDGKPFGRSLLRNVLTRAGRDGTLRYVRDMQASGTTPAIAFDTGFVGGYIKGEALPAGAPRMATRLTIAGRCLDQKESNMKLCSSAGYMLALRAAKGELVPVF